MVKKMLIDSSQPDETRMAIIKDEKLLEYESEVKKLKPIKGNIYLAKIIRVEPSLQAAFVDYGASRHGFLAYNEIHPDYFKIPTSDREKILAKEREISENYSSIDEAENDFLDQNSDDQIGIEKSKLNEFNKKGFFSKFFDFFNFKPIKEDEVLRKEYFIKNEKKQRKYKNNSNSFHRKYSIQEVIKRNQVILIQVVKEERGNKGAAITTRLSLAGKYCVLMPNTNKGGGVSRKIVDINLRKNLKEILSSLEIKNGVGVIIRTAGQNINKTNISRDYKALLKLWSQITNKTIKSTAPCLIHEEGDLLKRSIRDYFSSDIDEVIINNEDTFNKSKDVMKFFMPSHVKLLKLNKVIEGSLFGKFKIEKQINEMYKPIVYLKSGGYLVINQTEALVAIDVNSGKYTKQRNIEDTALKTNLEAAEEIPFQLRLRDLAGLIVIDFIDMLERSNNFKVERKVKESIKSDRARIQFGRISNFGLMEVSRQRLKQVINTATTHKCDICSGTGRKNSIDFTAMQILRVCEETLMNTSFKNLTILVNHEVARFMKEHKKKFFNSIIKKSKRKIYVKEFLQFSISDSAICSNNEIIYDNCDDEFKLNEALKFLDVLKITRSENSNKSEKNREIIENEAKEIVTKKINEEKKEISEKSIKKSVSFRAKAEDFNKSLKKEKSIDKLKKRGTKLVAANKNKKQLAETDKKHGWWNQ